jgi:4-hydroxy-tetrahydrodipicolinate synthase
MIMLMPPYHGALLKASEEEIFTQLSRISENINLPIMIQDAPLSGVALSVEFLAKLANEIANVSYFKIEVPGTAKKLRALIKVAGDSIVGPFDGEEAITLVADLQSGATGTMSSAMYPELLKPIITAYSGGDIDSAHIYYNQILPLINYENRQCGLQGTKFIMKSGGVIRSDTVRHPLSSIDQSTRTELLRLAHEHNLIALRWGS